MPVNPGCIPQSSIIFLPLNSNIIQERPTSWPAPLSGKRSNFNGQYSTKLLVTYSGLICSRSLSSSGTRASFVDCDCDIFISNVFYKIPITKIQRLPAKKTRSIVKHMFGMAGHR